jgi:uncharacterized protein
MIDLEKFREEAESKSAGNKKFLQGLKKKSPSRVDDVFAQAHQAVFSSMECLTCANCCKTTSPIFTRGDIERLSRTLGMKPMAFIDTYLQEDAEGDRVLKSSPCPFLLPDNACMVYEDRPKACREYPHTDRKKMHQILGLTHRNSLVCPAVLKIIDQIKSSV